MTKTCTKCNRELSLENFNKSKLGEFGLKSECKICVSIYFQKNKNEINEKNKQYRSRNYEKVRAAEIRYYKKTREIRLLKMKKYTQDLKQRVFDIYGNKCACCEETNREFFAVDHIEGGGTKERRRLGSRGIFLSALRADFEKDKYQILCHNCNMSIGFYGYCPHNPSKIRPVRKGRKLFSMTI